MSQARGTRRTIVYHQVTEDTHLLNRPMSNSVLDHAIIANKKRVYTAITLADIFQKVVSTTMITTFLLYAYTYLDCGPKYALVAYFTFSSVSWYTAALINILDYGVSKRRSIVFGFVFFILGLLALAAVSGYIGSAGFLKYVAMGTLCLVCLGESMCKTLIGEFGHDQFVHLHNIQSLQIYADRLYWVGHLCAILLIVFLSGIIEFANFQIGFGLCCAVLLAGITCFFIGWSRFVKPGRVNENSIQFLYRLTSEARSLKTQYVSNSIPADSRPHHWLDYACVKFGGSHSESHIEEAKSLLKMTAIFASFIPYWLCNAQGYSTFLYQCFHLNTSIGNRLNLAISWVALANIVAVLIFVKIFERCVYPALRRHGQTFPTEWRIICGMLSAALAMALAGILQYCLQHKAGKYGTVDQRIGDAIIPSVKQLHLLLAVPQLIFLGLSEMLVGLTGLAMACKMCPDKFQKTVTSVYYFMIALGNTISLVIAAAGAFPAENFLADESITIYFFTLSGVAVLGVIIFTSVMSLIQEFPLALPVNNQETLNGSLASEVHEEQEC